MVKVRKKTLALYPFGEKMHTIYNPTIDFLRERYNLIYNPLPKKDSIFLSKASRNKVVYYVYHNFIRRLVSLNDLRSLFKDKIGQAPKNDLVLASNEIPDFPCNFILDLEIITALAGYDYNRLDKRAIKKSLESDYCKAVICWNEISKKSLLETIDCKHFMDKIHVIPFAAKNPIQKKWNNKKKTVNLLFVSSVNNPYDFERKGGIIALEAYKLLVKKYENLSFTIRAHVPKWIKTKYSGINGIIFKDYFLSDKEMKNLFLNTDLLFIPVPGMNLMLEAMEYSLPTVAFDFWSAPEMVSNSNIEFLVDASSIFGKRDTPSYFYNHGINYLKMFNKNPSKEVVDAFIRNCSGLIESKSLRKKIGLNAGKMAQKGGKYSLEKRNNALSKIIDKALINN